MGFCKPILTAVGKDLYLSALKGDVLQFTKIKIGDGKPTSAEDVANLLEIVSVKKTLELSAVEKIDNEVEISAAFNNEDVKTSFCFSEFGVFAIGKDGKEKLFCYAFDDNAKDLLPAIDEAFVEKTLKVALTIGDAENVTVVVKPENYVTYEKFENEMVTKLENADILNDFDGYITWLGRTSGTAEQKRKLRPSLNIDKLDERYAKSSQAPAFLEIGSSIMDESEDTVLDSNISRNRIWLAEVIASGATQTCNCTGFLFNDGQNHFQGGFSALYEGKGTSGKVPANIIIEFDYNSSTGALKNVSIKGYYYDSDYISTTSLAIGTLYAVI